MFENQSSKQNPFAADKAGGFSAPPSPLPNTASAPEFGAAVKNASEPEDIFDKVSPLKPAAEAAPPADALEEQKADEPELRQPPSVFNRGSYEGLPPQAGAAVARDVPMPQAPKAPGIVERKNVVLFIVFVVLALAAAAGAAWWFFGRGSGSGAPADTASQKAPGGNKVYDLYNNQIENKEVKEAEVPVEDNTAKLPELESPLLQPQDTDEDGLTDEEESALGTSINSADTDGDGLFDREEVKIYKTDPLVADTDGDKVNDGDEIKNNSDPLVKDQELTAQDSYSNDSYKVSFEFLPGMTFESDADDIILFNDNVNQIKLYVYANGSEPEELAPDRTYKISQSSEGQLIIDDKNYHADSTPNSTELDSLPLESTNGRRYLFRYVATRRADNHESNFERILASVRFLP